MKFVPSQIGAEPKKIAILGGLVLVLAVVYFLNRAPATPPLAVISPGADAVPAPEKAPPPLTPSANVTALVRSQPVLPLPPPRAAARRGENAVQDFRPTLKLPDGVDVASLDPELHLGLMAKVREVSVDGGRRSLFEFGAAPPPPLPKVAPVKPSAPPPPAAPAPPPAPVAPPKPVAPPIPLKFYGFVRDSATPRRGFFLDGEDIVVAGDNDTIRGRYHVLRVTATNAVVEDTVAKSQQTLALVEEVQ